jgi:hypothetical protein
MKLVAVVYLWRIFHSFSSRTDDFLLLWFLCVDSRRERHTHREKKRRELFHVENQINSAGRQHLAVKVQRLNNFILLLLIFFFFFLSKYQSL